MANEISASRENFILIFLVFLYLFNIISILSWRYCDDAISNKQTVHVYANSYSYDRDKRHGT